MKRRWETDELVDHWTLLPAELTLLANKTGATRLGFAVLLKSFQVEARFPQRKQDVPGAVVVFVAKQVGVAAEGFLQYQWRGRTIEYHRAQIRTALGFREATEQDEAALASWLTEAALAEDRGADRLKLRAYERCRALGLEPPAPGQMDRLIRSAAVAMLGLPLLRCFLRSVVVAGSCSRVCPGCDRAVPSARGRNWRVVDSARGATD